jgi:hypothetical protein
MSSDIELKPSEALTDELPDEGAVSTDAFSDTTPKEEAKVEDKAKDNVIGVELTLDGKYKPIRTTLSLQPSVRNQRELYPDTVSIARQETFILDLSKPEDLVKLNKLDTDSLNPDSGTEIINKDVQFYNGKWSAMVTILHYQFQSLMQNT